MDAPPPPWEAQRPPGIEMPSRLPASVVDLCYRALDCRHVCTVANGPVNSRLCSPLLVAWVSIFAFRFCSDTSANFYRNRNEFDLRLRFSILFGLTLRAGLETIHRLGRHHAHRAPLDRIIPLLVAADGSENTSERPCRYQAVECFVQAAVTRAAGRVSSEGVSYSSCRVESRSSHPTLPNNALRIL